MAVGLEFECAKFRKRQEQLMIGAATCAVASNR